jgi:hypothetical protein
MILHIVLLKPRADLTGDDRRRFLQAFETAIRDIETVRGVRFGVRVRHGAGYEAAAPDHADVLAIIEFDDIDGLKTYLRHPSHAELGKLFGTLLSGAAVYDFEAGGLELLQTLV